jgi:hypothetical protein
VAQAVGMKPVDLVVALADQPGLLGELGEEAVDGLAVVGNAGGGRACTEAAAVLASEDRALGARLS